MNALENLTVRSRERHFRPSWWKSSLFLLLNCLRVHIAKQWSWKLLHNSAIYSIRSSQSRCFVKKVFFNEGAACNFIKKETLTQEIGVCLWILWNLFTFLFYFIIFLSFPLFEFGFTIALHNSLIYGKYIYIKWHQTFTEKFYGANAEGPSKCQNINDSFKVWFAQWISIKFLTGYYLMSFSYYIVIPGYKYTEYDITTLRQYNVIILIVSQNSFLFFRTESVPNNL